MSVPLGDHLDLNFNELRNALAHPVNADPDFTGIPTAQQQGRIWYNTTDGKLKYRDALAGVNRAVGDIVVDNTTLEIVGGILRIKDGGVTSAKLADATIVNADVAVGAAIDRAKLDPATQDTATRQIATTSGTAAPGFTHPTDTDTGVHLDGSGRVALVSNGTVMLSAGTSTVDITARRVTGVSDPTAAQDAATKNYVDNLFQGIDYQSARATTPAGTALNTLFPYTVVNPTNLQGTANGVFPVLDGVTLAFGDVVLLKDEQSAGVPNANNGLWVLTSAGSAGSKWSLVRAPSMDTAGDVDGKIVVVEDGNTLAGSLFLTVSEVTTIGTDAIAFTKINTIADFIAGAGLTKTGNTVDVNIDATELEIVADVLGIKDGGVKVQHIAVDAVGGTQLRAASIDKDRLAFNIPTSRALAFTGDGATTTFTLDTGYAAVLPTASGVQVWEQTSATDVREILVGIRQYVSGGTIRFDITFGVAPANTRTFRINYVTPS